MIRNDFALDYTQSGLLISAFSLSYGIGHLPAGWLADRIGYRVMITLGISGVALAGLFIGLAPTYIMMIVFMVLMGLSGGGYHPASTPVISASVEPQNRGRALGIHIIGGSASYFLSPLIAAAIAVAWGWRGSFITLAVPTFALGIVIFMLLGRRIAKGKPEERTTTAPAEAPPPGHLRRLVSFITLSTLTQAITFATISFIPLFLVDHFGIDEEAAAALLGLTFSAGFWAGPLGGYLSDRLGRVPVILAVCFIAGPTFHLLTQVPYGWGIGALLLIIGMVIYVRMPVSEAYIITHTSDRNRSTILGIYYFTGVEGSGVLAPVMGHLIDQFGFHFSFTVAGAAIFTATLLCSIWLWGSRD
jgi:MFS family permease